MFSSSSVEINVYSNVFLLWLKVHWLYARSILDDMCFLGIGSPATIACSITVVLSHQPSASTAPFFVSCAYTKSTNTTQQSTRMQKVYIILSSQDTQERAVRDVPLQAGQRSRPTCSGDFLLPKACLSIMNATLPEVFDLSSLSSALDEDIAAQKHGQTLLRAHGCGRRVDSSSCPLHGQCSSSMVQSGATDCVEQPRARTRRSSCRERVPVPGWYVNLQGPNDQPRPIWRNLLPVISVRRVETACVRETTPTPPAPRPCIIPNHSLHGITSSSN
ncbi:hypothetical protein JOM56_008956 [Amanita muscaria]